MSRDDEATTTLSPGDETPAEAQARKFQRELSAGLTSLVLLSVLAEAETDLYGYEIARKLTLGRSPNGSLQAGRPLSGAAQHERRWTAVEPRGPLLFRTAAPLLPHYAARA